jgi:hypothetical protein
MDQDMVVIWDLEDDPDGNYQHILEHGITADEVEEVLRDSANPITISHSSGRPIVFGWTSLGNYIGVPFDHYQDDPKVVRPRTAFHAPPPRRRRP